MDDDRLADIVVPPLSLQLIATSAGAALAILAGVALGSYLKFDQEDLRVPAGPHLVVRGLN